MTDRTQHHLDVGDSATQPLGWPPFIVTVVHQEYFEAKPYDGTAGYGDAQPVAKSPEQRQSLNGGVAYGATDDIILAAPVLTTVRNDADNADVVCQHVQVSGALPVGGDQYQGLYFNADGLLIIDYARFH